MDANYIGRLLFVLMIYGVIWGIPLLVGWNILRRRRPHDGGDISIAIFLLVVYGIGSSFIRVMRNDDMPAYAFLNEAFMFCAERDMGLKNLYDRCQDGVRKADKVLPHMALPKYCSESVGKESAMFVFTMNRGTQGALKIEIKAPDKEFSRTHQEEHEYAWFGRWNENSAFSVDRGFWRTHTARRPFARQLIAYLEQLIRSVIWLVPLAAAACKAQTKWRFGILWCIVLVFYIINFRGWLGQTPTWQYERCDPETAVAQLSANHQILSELLKHPTAVLEHDKSKTIIDAPLLCSGEFFGTGFLCWDLGKSNYLYYSPSDLIQARLITGNAQVSRPAEDFYLVGYPDFARAANHKAIKFAVVQTVAGLLWLGMFIWALKNRRKLVPRQE